MRGSLKVPTAARHISWVIITGVTFCAVCIYVLGFSAESAADQSAELQIQRVFFPLNMVDAAAPQTSRQSESIHSEPATVSKCARC